MFCNRIAVDFSFVSDEEIKNGRLSCSIPVFLSELLDEISVQGYKNDFIIIANANAYNLLKQRFPAFDFISIGGLVAKASFLFLGKQMNGYFRKNHVFEKVLIKKGIKHIWYPYMLPELVAGNSIEYIGTCHDLMRINGNYNEYYNMFCCANAIVTVSEYVKHEITEKFAVPDSKIVAIHNSIKLDNSANEFTTIKELENLEFILDVNAYTPRKNTMTILKAYKLVKNMISCHLVLCGGYKDDLYFQECKDYVRENNMEDRVFFYYAIAEKEKNWLFHNCKLFVMPSENEGFGRTPIEAAVCLKPVISTRSTSLEEATCGLVRYYDNPKDEVELAAAIMDVLNNPPPIEVLESIKGTFINKYAPKNIARQYIDLFHKLMWL